LKGDLTEKDNLNDSLSAQINVMKQNMQDQDNELTKLNELVQEGE